MKKLIKYLLLYFLAASMFMACSLEEDNKSALNSITYFKGEAQYEELVNQAYIMLRPLLRNTNSMFYGTDIYERTGEVNDVQLPINDYTVMTNDECYTWWVDNYYLIAKVNVAFDRSKNLLNIPEAKLKRREAELHALRAYAYFNLVETFGGVPLLLNEILVPQYSFTRALEEEIYTQILSDLNIALEAGRLPQKPEAFGHISQGMVNHLMAKVLLTKSYKSYAASDDLSKSITYAQAAIALHPLAAGGWDVLFGAGSYVYDNTEAIFSVRYSANEELNGSWGNNLYQHFKFWTDQFPGGGRMAPYWRQDLSYQPTVFYLNLFDAGDIRASQKYLQRTIFASKDSKEGNNGEIKAGDPVIYLPKEAMTEQEKIDYKAAHAPLVYIVNPDEYHKLIKGTNTCYPIVWKFYDPNVKTYTDDRTNPRGTRDTYIFRTPETMMLLAEAYVKQGNGLEAKNLINQLRSRAGATLLDRNATLDDVLDESGRELFGESNRWMELKRSGNLLTRAQKYNVYVKKFNPTAVPEYFALRPIPQTEINFSPETLKQNPGYLTIKK